MADAKQGGGCGSTKPRHRLQRWLCGEVTEVSAVVDRISSLEIDTDDIADLTAVGACSTRVTPSTTCAGSAVRSPR